MIPKSPINQELFNSGVCDVKLDDKILFKSLRFDDKVIGSVRHYAARQVDEKISRLISVPQQRMIDSHCTVTICNEKFDIEQVQHINDTSPPTTKLSLKTLGFWRE